MEYVRAVHPERLGGIIGIVALLCDRHPDWAWQRQAAATYEALKRAQSSAYIYVVREDFADFDPDTPAYPKIYKRAQGRRARRSCRRISGKSPEKTSNEIGLDLTSFRTALMRKAGLTDYESFMFRFSSKGRVSNLVYFQRWRIPH